MYLLMAEAALHTGSNYGTSEVVLYQLDVVPK